MNKAGKIKEKIVSFTRQFYKVSPQGGFMAGKTRVNYAGRVYDEKELVNLVVSSLDFWLTGGRYTQRFENKLGRLLGRRDCLLTNSGSSANLLAVSALTSPYLKNRKLSPGDEVITTACGFPTTLNPIIQNNLTPVFIDVKIGTYNIEAEKIEKAVTSRTKAMFIPHTLGNPADIDSLLKAARRYNLWFCEDNCDALGSRYKGKPTGTFGDLSTCSFYPAHHITTGEGGAVLMKGPLLKRIILSYRDWGRDCWCESGHDNTCRMRFRQQFAGLPYGYDHKYVYSHIGYNLKATEMQAAIGLAQLDKLSWFTQARKKNFNFLYGVFDKYGEHFVLPRTEEGADPSWFGFPVTVKEGAPFKRADIVNYLESRKIATRMLFGGNLTRQPAYRKLKFRIFGSLKNTDTVMSNTFWLGVYPGLTRPMLEYIEEVLEDFFKDRL